MSLVFGGDASYGCCRDSFRMEDDSSKEVVILLFLSRDVPLARYEDGSFCVIGSKYYWELRVVDPSSFPIYFWLRGSKPWVSEDGFLLSKLGKVKSEIGMIGSCLYLQVGVVTQLPASVLGAVDV